MGQILPNQRIRTQQHQNSATSKRNIINNLRRFVNGIMSAIPNRWNNGNHCPTKPHRHGHNLGQNTAIKQQKSNQ